MRLYTYFRSSAAWRVRIELALKRIDYIPDFVHLQRRGGEHFAPAYRARNPAALVPLLETDDGALIPQSLAILEWLEHTRPSPPLLPGYALARSGGTRAARLPGYGSGQPTGFRVRGTGQ